MGLSVVGAVGSSGWSGIAGSSGSVMSVGSLVSVDSLDSSGSMGDTALSRSEVEVETVETSSETQLSDDASLPLSVLTVPTLFSLLLTAEQAVNNSEKTTAKTDIFFIAFSP